jgi:hypothetical protein
MIKRGGLPSDGGNKGLFCGMLAKAALKRAFTFTPKKPKSSRNLRYDPLSFAVA